MCKIPDDVKKELTLLIEYCWDADIPTPKHTIKWLGSPDPSENGIPNDVIDAIELGAECLKVNNLSTAETIWDWLDNLPVASQPAPCHVPKEIRTWIDGHIEYDIDLFADSSCDPERKYFLLANTVRRWFEGLPGSGGDI